MISVQAKSELLVVFANTRESQPLKSRNPRPALTARYYPKALRRLNKPFRNHSGSASKIKGVLLVADAASSAQTTIDEICLHIEADGPFDDIRKFRRPNAANSVAEQPEGHPLIAIMLVPLDGTGALESICAASLIQAHPWIETCVESYLACEKIGVSRWSPEKRAKAKMQCLIAALNEEDPNKGLGHLFHKNPPLIDLSSTVFDPITAQIERFRDEVRSLR